jgi:hypothetical protein
MNTFPPQPSVPERIDKTCCVCGVAFTAVGYRHRRQKTCGQTQCVKAARSRGNLVPRPRRDHE